MFAERKDAVEMALGIALLILSAKIHWRTWSYTRSWVLELAMLLPLTFVAVLLILLGTW